MKPTKEEILNKHLNKLPPEYVTYIPKRERDARQYTLDAMQEYAEQFHKEKLREELIKFQTYCNEEQVLYVSDFIIDEYLKTLNTK
jgi:hypothetical protein